MKIEVDVPEDLQRKARMLKIELSLVVAMGIKRALHDLEEIEEIEKIAEKSKATEEDVEELSDEINEAASKYYSKYK